MTAGRPSVDDDKRAFLARLAEKSGTCGNVYLRRTLNWTADRYWRTHTDLFNEGIILRGKGRGGSVILATTVLPPRQENEPQTAESEASSNSSGPSISSPRESMLYEPASRVIFDDWVKERAFDVAVVEITATSGARASGTWTRPDITVVASKSYQYLPGRSFEIITFEVKKVDAVDVRGVFEALSHRRFATMSYVLFFTGEGSAAVADANLTRIRDIARDHGVGVITAEDINDYETWEELVDARRNVYNPEEANAFLGASLSDDTKAKIIQWQK